MKHCHLFVFIFFIISAGFANVEGFRFQQRLKQQQFSHKSNLKWRSIFDPRSISHRHSTTIFFKNPFGSTTSPSDEEENAAFKGDNKPSTSSSNPPLVKSGSILDSEVSTSARANVTMGLSQIKPFLNIAVPFFKDDEVARKSLIGVVALTLLNSGISVAFSYLSRDFYNALSERNDVEFYQKIGLFFGFLLLAVPVTVAYRFYREKLSLYWREALTTRVLQQYYSNKTFYILETLRDEALDNPDQRIAEDIRAFTRTSLDFFITIFTSLIDLFAFSAILFQIYPGLFVAIVAYAGIGSLVTTRLGQALVGLNYERLIKEANFRFSLIRTRENAESIAFYDAEAKIEQESILGTFQDLLRTKLGIVLVQRNLEVFTTAYKYLVQVLPSLIVAPLYFAKKVELGTISQSYGAFNHILGDFSIIINQFEALSSFSAGLTRLSNFLERINSTSGGWEAALAYRQSLEGFQSDAAVEPGKQEASDAGNAHINKISFLISLQTLPTSRFVQENTVASSSSSSPPPATLLVCNNLTVATPDGSRVLIGGITPTSSTSTSHEPPLQGIDVNINAGDSILIVGPSGAGKSSFLRAIAGLWRVGSGSITWATEKSQTLSSTPKASFASPVNLATGSTDASSSSSISPTLEGVFFLPQKPYNLLGSLRQQIMYPSIIPSATGGSGTNDHTNGRGTDNDQRLLEILRLVRLENLAARMGGGSELRGLDASQDWSKVRK